METNGARSASKPCNRNVYFLLSELTFTFFCFAPIILHAENTAKETYCWKCVRMRRKAAMITAEKGTVISVPQYAYRNSSGYDCDTEVSRSPGRHVASGGRRGRKKKKNGGKTFFLVLFCLALGFGLGLLLPWLWESTREEIPAEPPAGTAVNQTRSEGAHV